MLHCTSKWWLDMNCKTDSDYTVSARPKCVGKAASTGKTMKMCLDVSGTM